MYRLIMLLILGGAILSWHGYQEFKLGRSVKAEGHQITCAELGENGPGQNAHVYLTDQFLCPAGFIWRGKNQDGPWSTIYIPAVSSHSLYAQRLAMIPDPRDLASAAPPSEVHV